jgi:transposase
VIPLGVEIFVALEPVDMRLGIERLGGLVRERIQREPRSKAALFVFFARHRQSAKLLWWDGTGMVLCSKKLDHGLFERPTPARQGDACVVLSDAAFEALFAGLHLHPVH